MCKVLFYLSPFVFQLFFSYVAQFGPWDDRPQHGFARIIKWRLKDEEQIVSVYNYFDFLLPVFLK